MKNRVLALVTMALLVSVSQAQADSERWYSYSGKDARFSAHERWGYRGGHHHDRWERNWSPWATVAIVGTTFYVANSLANQPVTTVIVPPPVVSYEPPRVAYFCQASQQYYPVVATCTMPWQAVNY